MADLIDRRAAIDFVGSMEMCDEISVEAYKKLTNYLENLPSANVVEVVRCKDCKHFPVGTDRDDLVFPDEVCPCHCEDFWYSWKPKDDFYCAYGERKDG